MFERIETPQELFAHKLGAALKMENTVLEMLGTLEEKAERGELEERFRHHAQETETQIRNLEAAFAALGREPDEKPCPAIEGLEKEGQDVAALLQENLEQERYTLDEVTQTAHTLSRELAGMTI